MKNLVIAVALRILAVALVGCAGGSSALKDGQLRQTIEISGGKAGWIEAMGIGAADPELSSSTQRRATSRNAAVVDAQYQLVAKIKGVRVEGGITVERAMESDSRIRTSVNEMIKGAEVTRLEWTKDDGCVAYVRLNRRAVEKEIGLRMI